MKKIIPLIGLIALLAGCSLFTEPPSEAKARKLEEGNATANQDLAIGSRTNYYKKKGLSDREATAAAEAEYARSAKK